MKEKNNYPLVKNYDPVSELKPLLMLTKEEEENFKSYEKASVIKKNEFWKPIYAEELQVRARKIKKEIGCGCNSKTKVNPKRKNP